MWRNRMSYFSEAGIFKFKLDNIDSIFHKRWYRKIGILVQCNSIIVYHNSHNFCIMLYREYNQKIYGSKSKISIQVITPWNAMVLQTSLVSDKWFMMYLTLIQTMYSSVWEICGDSSKRFFERSVRHHW